MENNILEIIDLWDQKTKRELPNIRLMSKIAELDPDKMEKYFLDNPEDLIKVYQNIDYEYGK